MQRIFFSFLTIRLSRLTRNKYKQCKEYFFHSSLSDFQDSLEINVNNAKNIFFIPLSDFQDSPEINVNNAKNIFFIPHYQTFKDSLEINVNNAKNIFFSFLTIRLSRLTRNKS